MAFVWSRYRGCINVSMKRRPIDEEHILRMQRKGLGRGYLSSYLPWIQIRRGDFSSSGTSSLVPDQLTSGRPHHTLSNGEFGLCLALLLGRPYDLREQFPLCRFAGEHPLLECGVRVSDEMRRGLPINWGTVALAKSLGIRHPRYPRSKSYFVLTTDFLVTEIDANGRPSLTAFSYRPSEKFRVSAERSPKKIRRMRELLELERRYWTMLGVRWHLITDESFPPALVENLVWAFPSRNLERAESKRLQSMYLSFFQVATKARWDLPLRDCLATVADTIGCTAHDAVSLFGHAIWERDFGLDLSQRILLPQRLVTPPNFPRTRPAVLPGIWSGRP